MWLRLAYWLIVWLAVIFSSLLDKYWIFTVPFEWRLALRTLGVIVVGYSVLLSSLAGRTLKRYGHLEPEGGFKAPDRLVTVGIYSCMRHPNHFGLALLPIGLALLLASPTALIFSGWGVAAAMFFLVWFEEPENLSKFGLEYVEYMKRVPPFRLSIKCLVKGFKALREKQE